MNFKEFKYERPNLEELTGKVEDLLHRFEAAKSLEEAEGCLREYNDLSGHLSTQLELASIRFSIDTRDEFYKKENDYWDEHEPMFEKLDFLFKKAVLASPYREELKKKLPETYFTMAQQDQDAFSEEIIEDLQKENQLSSEYDTLIASAQIDFQGKTYTLAQLGALTESPDRELRKAASEASWGFFEENEEKFDRIFDDMVKTRTAIAKKLGFDSFVDLAYLRMHRMGWDRKDVEKYRKMIRETVVPVCNELYERQQKRLGLDKLAYYDLNLEYPEGNAKPEGSAEDTLEAGRSFYHELSEESGEFIDLMLDSGLMDVLAKTGKQSGGYMTFLPDYKVPFIFSNFNGTSGDINVLTHEAGHAFQGYQSRNIEPAELVMPTEECCEIHSMSMEFFAWPYIEKFCGEQADKYRFAHLADATKFLPYGALVDHFQHEVYEHPDMTPEERKACWRKLDKIYRPHLDFEDNRFADKGTWWFKQGHIWGAPFYYIDYTLAQVCAFQFWSRLQKKDPEAWTDYLKLCRVGGTKPFLKLIKEGNLKSPFQEGVLADLMKEIGQWLKEHDTVQE